MGCGDLRKHSKVFIGVTVIGIGILIAGISNEALDLILRDNMVLSPTSQSYPMWKDLPVPLIAKFYLFNVSNANEVAQDGAKPRLVEMGPYIFQVPFLAK